MGQQHAIHKFVLGTKDFDDKQSEFMYDKGWYSITDIVGEEKNIIYKSRNAQEAYLKWNIYIGRKKERLTPEERKRQREERYEKKREQNRENTFVTCVSSLFRFSEYYSSQLFFSTHYSAARSTSRFWISSLVGITRSAPFLVVITEAAAFANVSISFRFSSFKSSIPCSQI